jgi:hypothetical protein
LWAIGVYDFGLTEDQFWALTPAQFSALSDRFDQHNMQLDFRAGIIASTMANTVRSEKTPPFTPQMFMPNYDGEEVKPAEMSGDEILRQLQAAFPRKPTEAVEDGG